MKQLLFISPLCHGRTGHFSRLAALILAFMFIFGRVSLGAAPLQLGITNAGSNLELTWTNESDVRLQSSLALGGDWTDLPDAVSPYQTPIVQPKVFFRLRRIPVVQSVEPAFLPAAGGTIYVAGLNFTANTTLLLNGVPAGAVTFVDSSHLTINIGPLATGVYDISLVNYGPGNVLAKALTVNTTGTRDEAPPGMAATALGEFRETAVDLAIPAPIGPDFVLARTYRSRFGPANSPMGKGWDFSGNIFVQPSGDDVIIHDGGGRADTFFRQSDGTYTRPEFFREGTVSGQIFTLTFADKSRWVFRPFNAASAPGKIAQSIDQNGNTMTYAYNGTGQLSTVTDALNRAVQFAYNGSGLLTTVTDFAGRVVSYTYDANGNLVSMTTPAVTGTLNGNDFPSGKTITYTYTSGHADQNLNHNLTSIIDNTGTVILTNTYSTGTTPGALDYDRLVSSALGANPPTVFSYEVQTPNPANRYATTQVYINDPVGNVAATLYDAKNRPVQTRHYTGRATPGLAVSAVGNQPTNKLRASDPAYFETTATYNVDSLPVQITEPRGNSMAMLYAGDANPATPVRERGNLLTLTQTPAPGVPSDQTQITEMFEYLPEFGTGEGVMAAFRRGHRVNGYYNLGTGDQQRRESGQSNHCPSVYLRPSSMTLEVSRNKAGAAAPNMEYQRSRIIKYTDPRGNIWNYNYDVAGNLTSALPPGAATGDSYEYNAAGQLTAHTHPADGAGYQQRDTFEYFTSGASTGLLKAQVCGTGAWGSGGLSGAALRTSFTYDSVGNLASVTDPRGNDTQFVFNQLDQLMQVKSAPGAGGVRTETSFAYDASDGKGNNRAIRKLNGRHIRLIPEAARVIRRDVSHIDSNGNPVGDGKITTIYGRDFVGRLTSVTSEVSEASSVETRLEYDAAGQLTAALSPLAVSGADAFNKLHYSYDERGLPFHMTAAPGSPNQSTTQYDYDANGNLNRIAKGLEGTPQVTKIESDGFAFISTSPYEMHMFFDTAFMWSGPPLSIEHGGTGARDIESSFQLGSMAMKDGVYDDMWVGEPLSIIHGGTGAMALTDIIRDNDWSGPPLSVQNGGTGANELIDIESLSAHGFNSGGASGNGGLLYIGDVSSNLGVHRGGYDSIRDDFWTGPPLSVQNGGTGALSVHHGAQMPFATHYQIWRAAEVLSIPKGSGSNLNVGELMYIEPDTSLRSRPTKITDPIGNVTEFHYDASGNLVRTAVFSSSGAGGPESGASSVKLSETTYYYDALGRLANVSAGILDAAGTPTGGASVTAVFADNGHTSSVSDPLGHGRSYAYDSVGRLSSVTDPKGNAKSYGHDANGNVTTVTTTLKSDLGNPDVVLIKSYTYDKLNRCTSASDNVGNTDEYAYDSLGRPVKALRSGVFGHYRADSYEYDNLSRLTRVGTDLDGDGSVLGANDIVTSLTWDDNSRLLTTTDAKGNSEGFIYDGHHRWSAYVAYNKYMGATRVVHADGTTSLFSYDLFGNVASSTDANGTVVAYTYDLNNRLTRKDVTPAAGIASTTTYEQFSYDGLGRVLQATNDSGTTSFTYDSLGNLLTESQNGLTVTSTYDAAGNRLSVAYPGGRTIGYAYDTANLPTTVSLLASNDGEAPGVLSTSYYIGGRLERVDNRNNTRTSYSYNGVSGTANAPGDSGWGQVSRVQTVNSISGTVIDDTTYLYDAAQNLTGKITSFPGKVTAKVYQYDAADRLVNTVVTTNSAQTANIIYTLDKTGKRLNVTGDNHPGVYTLSSTLPEPADFQVNQYTTTPVGNFSYDKNGNRISETSGATTLRTFSYDFADRLVAINSGSSGTPIAVYSYDALGRRSLKGAQSGATSNTTRYVYDGDEVIEERDGGGNVTATITHGGVCGHYTQMVWATSTSVGCGIVSSKRNGSNYWPATDADGSTVALTLDNGTVAERYDYADFGEPAFFDGSGNAISGSAVGNPYLFDGMEYDSESGLYFRAGSMFDPRTGDTLNYLPISTGIIDSSGSIGNGGNVTLD